MSQREQGRLQVLNRVLEGWLRVADAARLLGVSERHVWRLLAGYRKEGAAALAHGNRGRKPAHTIGEDVKSRVKDLACGPYEGVNHSHLTELLAERECVVVSRSTVRRVLTAAGVKSPRRRRPPSTAAVESAIPRRGCYCK